MKGNIISASGSEITLKSGLKEAAFGKTDMNRLLEERGFLAEADLSGRIDVKEWKFDATKTCEDGDVVFTGKAFAGKTLLEYFEEEEKKDQTEKDGGFSQSRSVNRKVFGTVISVLSFIIGKSEEEGAGKNAALIPGAGGILIKEEDDRVKVLVLPGTLFDRAAANTKNYGAIQGIFMRKGLDDQKSSIFTRALLSYRMLTKKLPFAERDFEKRQLDIYDKNFMPVELEIKGIDINLAQSIDSGLKIEIEPRVIPGERRFENERARLERENVLKKAKSFDSLAFSSELEKVFSGALKNAESDAEWQKQRISFFKKQNRRVKTARFMRRNKNALVLAFFLVLGASGLITSFQKENRSLADTKGLTSIEAVRTLYAGVCNADANVIREVGKGKTVKNLMQVVSGFYVMNTQRKAFDQEAGCVTPAEWLFFKGASRFWQYGITNLTIDGAPVSALYKYPSRADKRKPLKAQNGIQLKKGENIVHEARYYLIYSDGSARLNVRKMTDKVTLKWSGKKWIVTDIYGKSSSLDVKEKDYKAAYTSALADSNEDIALAAEIIKAQYEFAPSEIDLQSAAERMIEQYNSSAAQAYLDSLGASLP